MADSCLAHYPRLLVQPRPAVPLTRTLGDHRACCRRLGSFGEVECDKPEAIRIDILIGFRLLIIDYR